MDEPAAAKVPGADAGPEEDRVGNEVSGDAAIGHEVEDGEGIVDAAGVGEADKAMLEGFKGGIPRGNPAERDACGGGIAVARRADGRIRRKKSGGEVTFREHRAHPSKQATGYQKIEIFLSNL